jgi:iron(III) transport system permease protein
MARLVVLGICAIGWLVLAAGVVAPLVGMGLAVGRPGSISTELVAVPGSGVLLLRSLTLALTATAAALILGVLPAAVLASAPARSLPTLIGLVLLPLLVPPQVYAYAWQLAASPASPLNRLLPENVAQMWLGGAVRAGLITAGWLWPVPAMILGAGWRSSGRTAYMLALLDTGPTRAYLRAVVPSLRPQLASAAGAVFAISLLEYAIPHLTRCRVYATELLVLVDAGAPSGQIMRMAVQVLAILGLLATGLILVVRPTVHWEQTGTDNETAGLPGPTGQGRWGYVSGKAWVGSAVIWLATVGIPIGIMAAMKPGGSAWRESFALFAREWLGSLGVAIAAGMLAVSLAASTALLEAATGSRWARAGGWMTFVAAAAPPAALGIGFVLMFNRAGIPGNLYTDTPCVWTLSLVGRYGAIAVLISWLAVGRRGNAAADQARTDGAGVTGVLAHVLLPMVWPSLLAAGLIVTTLSLFEVVITQMTGPVGYPSIAVAILGQMHYGRDNVVITTSLAVVAAGFVLTQVCGRLLVRREK